MSINRDQFLQEQLLREYIRKRLITKDTQRVIEEQQFRKAIRKLLIEAEATDEVPAESTGINVLADLLKKIVPTLEDGYKNLTTDKEQRDSYRAHIVNAVKRTIAPVDAQEDAAKKESMEYFYDRVLLEKIAINIGDEELFVKKVEGNNLTVERGHDQTVAASHLKGAEVKSITAADNALIEEGDDFGFDGSTEGWL